MPELLSHAAFARFTALPLRTRDALLFFLLGAVLPDLPAKFLILVSKASPSAIDMTHSLAGVLIFSWAASLLFEEVIRPRAFVFILLGAFSHIFLDSLKTGFYGGVRYLYPFVPDPFQAGLFAAQDTLWLIPLNLLLLFAFWKWDRRAK